MSGRCDIYASGVDVTSRRVGVDVTSRRMGYMLHLGVWGRCDI